VSKSNDFEQFFKDHYQSLFHFSMQMVGDEEVCRDLVSDALTVAWKRIDEVGIDNLKSFTFRLLHNKCVDYLRHEKARARYADFYCEIYDDSNIDAIIETERQIESMMNIMDTLSPRTREVLRKCYFERKKYADVAAELGISSSAVHKHIMKALRIFREGMSKKSK